VPQPPGIPRWPRRRPSGRPPPLPHHLQTTGVGWLIAAALLAAASVVAFAGGWRGPGLAVTVMDAAVVGWLAGLDAPGLLAGMRALAALGSWTAITVLLWGLLGALLVFRRLRQLLVVLVAWVVQGFLIQYLLAPLVQRPRPFGVAFRADWYAWALPAQQLAALATLLVGVLYGLVPEGRWRQTGKWVASAVVALVALAQLYLGVAAPTDVLVGVAIGVAAPLLGFRWFAPSQVFPITYRGGRAAHLDVGGARGRPSARPCTTSWGWWSPRSSRSACRARPARPRCASPWKATRPSSCSASSMPAATCARTAGTSSAGSSSTAGWRTRSRSTPCAGWSSRRTTPSRSCTWPGCPARGPTGSWS
jgi:membrane-associated phospholipid phosphatase